MSGPGPSVRSRAPCPTATASRPRRSWRTATSSSPVGIRIATRRRTACGVFGGGRLTRAELLLEPREELGLGRVDLRARRVDGEELGAVDFGEVLPAARSRWPLGLEGVALDGGRVEVALEGPGDDGLA